MKTKVVYLNQVFKHFGKNNSLHYQLTVKTMISSILEMLEEVDLTSIIDFGAGSGRFLFELYKVRRGDIQLTAVEKDYTNFLANIVESGKDSQVLEALLKSFSRAKIGSNVRLNNDFREHLPLVKDSSSFEAATLLRVIHCLGSETIDFIFQEMKRVTTESGVIIIADYHEEFYELMYPDDFELALNQASKRVLNQESQCWINSKDFTESKIKEHGLEIREQREIRCYLLEGAKKDVGLLRTYKCENIS